MLGALTIYLAGAALAAWRTDAAWGTRAVVAILWPLGPLAFAATISLLLAASLIAFPLLGLAVGAAALVVWALASSG